jgi:hypothetical protein
MINYSYSKTAFTVFVVRNNTASHFEFICDKARDNTLSLSLSFLLLPLGAEGIRETLRFTSVF